jgi:hypothetical protein
MDHLDIAKFRADQPDPPPVNSKPLPRHKAGEWFVKGPIPGSWLEVAARRPGHTLHVGLALWYLVGLNKCKTVRLTWATLRRFGLGDDAGRRGLLRLETAGLVTVERQCGSCPVVTILSASEPQPEATV